MYIKLDKESFENCNKSKDLKALHADLLVFTENGKVECIPAGSILKTVYVVDKKPKDSIEYGIKWIECTPQRCTFRDCFR